MADVNVCKKRKEIQQFQSTLLKLTKNQLFIIFFQIKKAQNDLINTVFLQCCISVDAGSTIVQRVGNNVLPLVLTVI